MIFDKMKPDDLQRILQKQNAYASIALENRDVESLKILLHYGAKCGQDQNQNRTLLMIAIINKHLLEIIQLLVENGEEPSKTTEIQISENVRCIETALTYACRTGSQEIVQYLCSKIDNIEVEPPTQSKTAVHWACESQNPEILRIVLDKPHVKINQLDERGLTGAFCIRYTTDEEKVIKMFEILDAKGFDFNLTGNPHKSVLSYFALDAFKKQYRSIEWLLQHKADQEFRINEKETIFDKVMISNNQRMKDLFKKWKTPDIPQKSTVM